MAKRIRALFLCRYDGVILARTVQIPCDDECSLGILFLGALQPVCVEASRPPATLAELLSAPEEDTVRGGGQWEGDMATAIFVGRVALVGSRERVGLAERDGCTHIANIIMSEKGGNGVEKWISTRLSAAKMLAHVASPAHHIEKTYMHVSLRIPPSPIKTADLECSHR